MATTNLAWSGLQSIPGLRDERPALKMKLDLSFIKRFSPYRAVNTVSVIKNQSVNAA
jgi:hypothetical protein